MFTKRQLILDWAEEGRIEDGQLAQAMNHSGATPDLMDWRLFIDRLLLAVGVLMLGCGVIFFFAYNWNDLGRFAKFGLVEGLIVLSLAAVWWKELNSLAGQAALFLSSVFVGVLLALIGQTYQTGADPFELFATWAVMIIPWALLARSVSISLLAITLTNLAIGLYYHTFGSFLWVFGFFKYEYLWVTFTLNTLLLVVWEVLVWKGVEWMRSVWATRLLATASGIAITFLMVIFAIDNNNGMSFLVWLGWLFAIYQYYRVRRLDVFVLAGACMSGIVSITALLAEGMLNAAGGFLMLGLIIIGMTAVSGSWLRNVIKQERAKEFGDTDAGVEDEQVDAQNEQEKQS